MNAMKTILCMMVVMCSTIIGFAQPPMEEMDENRREKIEALKRAYISQELDLTVSEAEKFWPVYNEYDKKKDVVRKDMRRAHKEMKEASNTEKQALETIDFVAKMRKEEVDLDSKFIKDCLPVLGVEKAMKLGGLEREFQRHLMEKLKERRHGGEGKGGKGGKGPKGPK